MSVLFYDSFDLNNADLPGTIFAIDYVGNGWQTTTTFGENVYADGFQEGQAYCVQTRPWFPTRNFGGYETNSFAKNQRYTWVGWYSRILTPWPSISEGNDTGFLMLGFDNDVYGLGMLPGFIAGNRSLRVMRGGLRGSDNFAEIDDIPKETFPISMVDPLSPNWEYYEFHLDRQTGDFWCKIGGNLAASGTFAVPPQGTLKSIELNKAQIKLLFDHLIVTDGEKPSGIAGVGITASWDPYMLSPPSSGGIRGTVVIGDQRYMTPGWTTTLGSGGILGDRDLNSALVHNALFSRNPATGEPWTIDSVRGLDGWGVCTFGEAFSETPSGVPGRLAGLALQYIDARGTFPIVRTVKADGLTYFSGNWQKTDEYKSMAAHINPVPRRTTGVWNEVTPLYLTIDTLGCLLFKGQWEGPLFEEIGVVFAEEYRDDYVDWAKVYSGGLPFESYFITGYSILGEGQKEFQSNYVTVNYEDLPVGGAYLQGVWDYALNGNTGRWSSKQQIYAAPSGNYKHHMRKLKVRGHGRAMQIRISSEENKNFRLNGWTVLASGNTSV